MGNVYFVAVNAAEDFRIQWSIQPLADENFVTFIYDKQEQNLKGER